MQESRAFAASVAVSVALHGATLAIMPFGGARWVLEPPRVLSVELLSAPPSVEVKPVAEPIPQAPPPKPKKPLPRTVPRSEPVQPPAKTHPPDPPNETVATETPAPKNPDHGEEAKAETTPQPSPSSPPIETARVEPSHAERPDADRPSGERAIDTSPDFRAAYLRNPPPSYPLSARRSGVEGTVSLRVLVGTDGTPRRVELNQSSGSNALDVAALRTVEKWRFAPARRGPTAIEEWVLVPVVFRLESGA
jgi:periplasmic protein TonB